MRALLPVLVLVGCEELSSEECQGRAWDGGSPLIDVGASVEPQTSEWIADLDDASVDVADTSFPEADCFSGEWTVTTEAEAMDGSPPDEVRAGVWNLQTRTFGEVVPLHENADGEWTGTLDGVCEEEAVSSVVAMPVSGGVWGRAQGTHHGAINGWGTLNGSGAATFVHVNTDGSADQVELLVVDLENSTAAGPTKLVRDGKDAFGNDKWIVPEADRVCREDGDFLLFGFIASMKERVVGAWAL